MSKNINMNSDSYSHHAHNAPNPSSNMIYRIRLDPDIRDWVVLPLFIIMVITGLIRHYLSMWLQNTPSCVSWTMQRVQQYIGYGRKRKLMMLLNHNSNNNNNSTGCLSAYKFRARQQRYVIQLHEAAVWCEEEYEKFKQQEEENEKIREIAIQQGKLAELQQQELEAKKSSNKKNKKNKQLKDDPIDKIISNPWDMMKGNMAFMVQNMVMMQGIQHFFSGFLLLQIPFSLSRGFKSMFQRGLMDMPDLHPSYVSSVSWYFLIMYGLRSFFQLCIGEPNLEMKQMEVTLQAVGTTMYQQGPSQPSALDHAKQLQQESEQMEFILTSTSGTVASIAIPSSLDLAEKRLLGNKLYPKKVQFNQNNSDDPTDFLMQNPTKLSTSATTKATSSSAKKNIKKNV